VLFFALLCYHSANGETGRKLLLDDALIQRVNSDPNATWRAGRNAIFENMTLEYFVNHKLGGILSSSSENLPSVKDRPSFFKDPSAAGSSSLPETFNPIEQFDAGWPSGCVGAIRDQGSCGSCWAFSAVEVLADRFCIWSGGSTHVVLSPQALVSCDHYDNCAGCGGGTEAGAWAWMMNPGVVPESCFPYQDSNAPCPPTCTTGENLSLYKATNAYGVPYTSMMPEMTNHGPVQACFEVYADLPHYSGGVYQHTYGAALGGHCVKIIGWGVYQGIPYWTVANSWGTGWGPYGGFFMIRRGVNECTIEQYVVAGDPAV